MSIEREWYQLDVSENGLVRVDYSSVRATAGGPHDFKATLWFERQNVPWVVEALRAAAGTYGIAEQSRTGGRDVLKVYVSGPEPEPYVNIENQRPADALHGGFRWFAMGVALAEKLATNLSTIR
jgi:hypothetical protein